MRKTLTVLVSLVLWATVFLPTSGAEAQDDDSRPWTEQPVTEVTPAPFSRTCGTLLTFESGCLTSGGAWTEAFSAYAAGNGIAPDQPVGARVQFFPQGSNPLDEVLYVVGPYLGATSDADDIDSLVRERAVLDDGMALTADLAPVMGPLRVRLRDLDASILYIGFGNFEDSQQPVSQRVVATKTAIRSFEAERLAGLGRAPSSTALLGISLGGVVGKISLRELENENFSHGVETYLSFDSPHWGAYTPPSLQYIPVFLHGSFRWAERGLSWTEGLGGNDLDDARDGANRVTSLLLRSPVAQDLLIINLAYPGWETPNSSYIRDRYRQLPRQTDRNVAIASGAIDGTRTPLGPRYFNFDTGKSSRSTLRMRLQMDVLVPSIDAPNSFYGRLSHTRPFGRAQYRRTPMNIDANLIENYERAPCAFSTEIVESVVDQLNHQLSSSLWSSFEMTADEDRACFIPTFSALIGLADSPGDSAFDVVIGDGTNKEHLATSNWMDSEILSEMDRVFAGTPTPPAPAADPSPIEEDPAVLAPDSDPSDSGPQDPAPTDSEPTDSEPTDSEPTESEPTESEPTGCDFTSGSHNLADTRAMFPAECGEAWNDQKHKCDYGDDGWRCHAIKP